MRQSNEERQLHKGRALKVYKGNPLYHWLNIDLYVQRMKLQETGVRTIEKKAAKHFLEVAQEHFAFSLAIRRDLSWNDKWIP